jgi:predicted GIY-YIG superfamily endonuclease
MKIGDLPHIDPPTVNPGGVFVYIVEGADGTLYVGNAKDVSRRIGLHKSGRGAKFTQDHGVAGLVYVGGPFDLKKAVQRELQIKRWSRAKKLALIAGDRRRLRELSRSRD